MKKYEISEEELQALIGVAAAGACDDEEFSGHDDMVMRVAAVIANKLINHLNGKAPFSEDELEIARKTTTASTEALAILSFLFGGV